MLHEWPASFASRRLDPDPHVPETNRSSEMRITVLSQTTPSGSQFPEDLAAIEEEPGKSETEARNLDQGLNDAKINWQAEAGKTWSIAQCLDYPSSK